MTTLEQILAHVKHLPRERQEEVLAFVESIRRHETAPATRKPLRGLWKGLGVEISEDDLTDARKEVWGEFPREDI